MEEDKPDIALQKKKEFVEKAGLKLERLFGFSPIVGRVAAYLFVAEPPEQTFFEIQDFIKASKSSISNALNHMIQRGSVEEITKPGERKRYFRLQIGKGRFPMLTSDRINMMKTLEELAGEAVSLRSDKDSRFTQDIRDMMELYQIIQEEFPKLIEKWLKRK